MIISPISPALYAVERAVCDKANAYWSANATGNSMSAELAAHPDYAACDNAMRGRVEQHEILRDLPEEIGAYIGSIDNVRVVTGWTGLPLGIARLVSTWRQNYTTMHSYVAVIGGVEYRGRGHGDGMLVRLRMSAEGKRRKAFAESMVADVLQGYVVAMLWSTHDESTPEGGEPMDSKYSPDDLDSDFLEACRRDCFRFLYRAMPHCTGDNWQGSRSLRYQSELGEQIGHDFWLTRAGHGCGFWDGDWKSDSRSGLDGPMTRIAKSFGEVSPYVGDDGTIYG